MTKTVSAFSISAITLVVLLHAGVAGAVVTQANPRTWVSGAGSDSNPCTRALPCATFNQAYSVTAPGGEIDILDGGDFGPLLIQRAITIANDGAGTAGIIPVANAINIAAGATDAVVLRGLTLNGVGATNSAIGVYFTGGASLLIDHCKIQGFAAGPGILFLPSTASKLWVTDTVLSNDGGNATVWINPGNAAAVTAHLERVQILNAIGNGIRADGTEAAPIDVELRDVTVDAAGGGSGVVAVSTDSGGPAVKLVADNVTVSHGAGYGFRAVGETASITLSRSVSEHNGVGLGVLNGGQILSYGDNRFAGNTGGNGVAPTAIPPE